MICTCYGFYVLSQFQPKVGSEQTAVKANGRPLGGKIRAKVRCDSTSNLMKLSIFVHYRWLRVIGANQ